MTSLHERPPVGAVGAVVRHQRRVAGDVPEDGVRFGDVAAGRDLEHRHMAGRIHRQEFRRAGLALEDVHLDELVRDIELRHSQADLVAITRATHGIELEHASSPRLRSDSGLRSKARRLQGHAMTLE